MVDEARREIRGKPLIQRKASKPAALLASVALLALSGCAQERGDWPTLASALGWGGGEPQVSAVPQAPVRAAAERGAPALTEWARPSSAYGQQSPSAAYGQLSASAAYGMPLTSIVATPPPPPTGYMQGENMVAQAFAQGLAATAPTVTISANGPTFAPSSAQALPADLSGVVPRVVLETYNDALTDSTAMGGLAMNMAAGNIEAPEAGPQIEYLDPTIIRFSPGSSRLSQRDKRRISKLVKDYKNKGGVISVIGHASSRTNDMGKQKHDLVNFEVSFDRANIVSSELIRQGVAPEHLVMEARADRDPIYYEYMPAGETGNQRVEIFLQ